MTTCQIELKRFFVDICRLNLSSGAFKSTEDLFTKDKRENVISCSCVMLESLKSLDLLKCSFFPPVRPSHLSSLVRMEAGGLATVADYWYELLKLLLTRAGKFISIWMHLIINLLTRASFYLTFLNFGSSEHVQFFLGL